MVWHHGIYEPVQSLIKLVLFALVVLLGFLNPIQCHKVWCLDLQFHLEALIFWIYDSSFFFVNKKKFYSFVLYRPFIFPSPTSYQTKTATEASNIKVFWMRTNACRNKTRWEWTHNTFTSCGILPTMHTTKLFTRTLPYYFFTTSK